ncbi:protein translocase subunit SecF [Candidatus Woesearchaeota archaeon]|nr:protein translocase subunit SecF [Candidatus Woesearchaeota archaeon]
MSKIMRKLEKLFEEKYKYLIFVPLILLLLSFLVLGVNYYKYGEIINKDVSLKGGITATIYTSYDVTKFEQALREKYDNADISVRKLSNFGTSEQKGIILDVSGIEEEELTNFINDLGIETNNENYSIEQIGSSLGQSFYRQTTLAIFFAFVLMALVVFLMFRTVIPSIAVVFAAFFDMIFTVAILDLMHIKISISGIAALLLLIGYSIDTDILLTNRVLRRNEGTVFERVIDSMKTGLTMVIAAMAALIAGIILVPGSEVIRLMFTIILIGLVADIIATYGFNAGILRWYVEKYKR